MDKNPALIEAKSWAWVLGLLVMPWFFRFAHENEDLLDYANSEKATYRKFRSEMLAYANENLMEVILHLRIPRPTKTLLKRAVKSPIGYRELESHLYQGLLVYGIDIAETLPLSFQIGVTHFDSKAIEASQEPVRTMVSKKLSSLFLRAELNSKKYMLLIEQYFDQKLDSGELLEESARIFFAEIGAEANFIQRFWSALELTPGFGGIGIDLKKLT
jgi:hypothetical protein